MTFDPVTMTLRMGTNGLEVADVAVVHHGLEEFTLSLATPKGNGLPPGQQPFSLSPTFTDAGGNLSAQLSFSPAALSVKGWRSAFTNGKMVTLTVLIRNGDLGTEDLRVRLASDVGSSVSASARMGGWTSLVWGFVGAVIARRNKLRGVVTQSAEGDDPGRRRADGRPPRD